MRYRLHTLMILAAVGPPLLAAFVRSPVAFIQWALSVASTIALAYAAAKLGGWLSGKN